MVTLQVSYKVTTLLPLSQTIGEDFAKFWGLLRIYELDFQSTKKLKNMYHRKQNLSFDAPLYKLKTEI